MSTLSTGKLTLRPPDMSDAKARYALGNSPEIHRMFGGDPADFRPLTEEGAEAWVGMLMRERYAWVIENDGRLVGSVRLHDVNPADQRASLAIGILDTSSLGKGVGTAAMRLVAAHAFDEIGLHRLVVRVLSFNTRAIAAYQKVGFQKEGVLREAARISGAYHDDLIMGLLDRDLIRSPS